MFCNGAQPRSRFRWAVRLAWSLAPLAAAGRANESTGLGHGLRAAPGNQPPTLGQDLLECGFLLLPERFWLRPLPSDPGWFAGNSAVWETNDGAPLVTCRQAVLPWSPHTVHCFVGKKLLFKYEDVGTQMELPGGWWRGNQTDSESFDTVVFQDCRNVVLYVLRMHRRNRGICKIYNRAGELLVQTLQARAGNQPDVMSFYDEQRSPVALAEGPARVAWFAQPETRTGELRTPQDKAPIQPWQISFADAYTTSSSLIIAQNRLAFFVALFVVLPGGVVYLGAVTFFGILFPPRQKLGSRWHGVSTMPYGALAPQ